MPVFGPKVHRPSTLLAGAAITRNRFVKRGASADHAVPATAASVNLGVALDHQDNVDEAFPIAHRPGETPLVEAGAAVALDALVTSDAQGRAVTCAAGQAASGVCRQAAGAAGDLIIVELVGPRVMAP